MVLFLDRLGQLALGPLRGQLGVGELPRSPAAPPPATRAGSARSADAAPGPVRTEQITIGRHDRDGRISLHELKPGRQVRHHEHPGEQPLEGGSQLTRRLHKIKGRSNGTHPAIALAMTGPAARPSGPRGRAARVRRSDRCHRR